jgi:hypothetical protein
MVENKRQLMAAKAEPRWAYGKRRGSELSPLVADVNNLYRKSLSPLGVKPLQSEPFRRTSVYTRDFDPKCF